MNDTNQVKNYKQVLDNKLSHLSKIVNHSISNTKASNYIMVALVESYLLTPVSKTFVYKKTNPKDWKVSRWRLKHLIKKTAKQVLDK